MNIISVVLSARFWQEIWKKKKSETLDWKCMKEKQKRHSVILSLKDRQSFRSVLATFYFNINMWDFMPPKPRYDYERPHRGGLHKCLQSGVL